MNPKRNLKRFTFILTALAAGVSCLVLSNFLARAKINNELIAAVLERSTQRALTALNKGADPNYLGDANGSGSGSHAIGRLLGSLFHGAKSGSSRGNTQQRRETVLILALTRDPDPYFDRLDVLVDALLAHGADPDARASDGSTPLLLAVTSTFPDCVPTLLAHGANPNKRGARPGSPSLLAYPLHIAVRKDAEVLLKFGASVDSRDSEGATPLITHCETIDAECIPLLLQHGASVAVTDNIGFTALHYAVESQPTKMVKMLLEYGAETEARTTDGKTPLMCAVQFGNGDATQLLLEHGADANARDAHGATALLMTNKLALARVLLFHGADPNLRGDLVINNHVWSATPLGRASESFDLDLASLLLDHGADVNAEDTDGRTALSIVIKANAPDSSPDVRGVCRAFVRMLITRGADVRKRSRSGESYLDLARRTHDTSLVSQLREASLH